VESFMVMSLWLWTVPQPIRAVWGVLLLVFTT